MLTELMKLGLSEKEAKVYLAALALGAQTAQEIAKKAGVNRATTYVILQGLMNKGLTSVFTKGKKTYFAAEPPEQLDHLLRKQEEDIFEHRRDLEKMIPELRALFHHQDGKPTVRLYEGHEGIRGMMNELTRSLPRGAHVVEFLALDEAMAAFPNYAGLTSFHLLERRAGARVIYTHRAGLQTGMHDPAGHREARYLSGSSPFASSIVVSPETQQVLLSSYRGGYAGVVIDNPEFAQTILQIFELVWATLPASNGPTKKPA